MVRRRFCLWFFVCFIWFIWFGGLAGCEDRSVSSSSPVKFEVYEAAPDDDGAVGDPDDDEHVAPSSEARPGEPRIQSPEAYSWAPQDRPIRFHTVEESGETRDEWGPYILLMPLQQKRFPELVPPDRTLSRFKIRVRTDIRKDMQLTDILHAGHQADREHSSIFVGLGGVFSDEYYHVFECRRIKDVDWYNAYSLEGDEGDVWQRFYAYGVGYYMGDYVAFCNYNDAVLSFDVYVLSSDEYLTKDHASERVHKLVESHKSITKERWGYENENIFPTVSKRFGELWINIVEKSYSVQREWIHVAPPYPDIDRYENMVVSFYYQDLKVGASSKRIFTSDGTILPTLQLYWGLWKGFGE